MRVGAYFALAAAGVAPTSGARAHAEPRLEASGFVGVALLARNLELGEVSAPAQVPGNGALFGVRLGLLALPRLAELGDGRRLQFGIEAEAAMSASSTRDARTIGPRVFAPVFQWRGHLMLRYVDDAVPAWPNLVVGAGAATLRTSSPALRDDTDVIAYYGGGFTIPLAGAWYARVDGRHTLFAARGGGITSGAEIQFGIGGAFGAAPPVARHVVPLAAPPPPPPAVVARPAVVPAEVPPVAIDSDGDGLADETDACPAEAERATAFANGDGCPDGVPAEVTKLLANASVAIKFEGARARVTDAAKEALAPVLALLEQRRTLRLEIRGRAATTELARRRADAVKWYLVDQGIAEGRFVTQTGSGKGAAVELSLILP